MSSRNRQHSSAAPRDRALRWTRMARHAAPLMLALGLFASCGRKEPPLPPPSLVPSAPQEVTVEQRGQEVVLHFRFPTTTIGGLPLESFEAIDIYELVRAIPDGFFDEPDIDEDEDAESGEGDSEDGDPAEENTDDSENDPDGTESEDGEDSAEEDTDDEGDDDESDRKKKKRKKRKKVFTVQKREFASAAQVRLRLEGAELAAATRGDRVSTRFLLQRPETEEDEVTAELVGHIFAAQIVGDGEKLISPFSNLVTLVPRETPPSPTGLSLEATAEGVLLQWTSDTVAAPPEDDAKANEEADTDAELDPDEESEESSPADAALEPSVPEEKRIVGFHIYRRLTQEPKFEEPLQKIDPEARTFIDRSAPYDARYVYGVSAIRQIDPVIESAIAEEREVDYRDRFAPPVPKNVAALAERGRVRLLWTPLPTPDLAGYLVFRNGPQGDDQLLTPTPTTDSEYIDSDVSSGDRVSYYVVAIDQVGNRSGNSAVTETTVP